MKTKGGFTLFDNVNEFITWLNKQNVTRKITRLQVHHMAAPDYNTWEKTDKKVYASDPELGRTASLNSYGVSKGWGGIAQHFNIFPNGKITTGRNLNKTPVGIRGWNTNALCIEILGNFDKGRDSITAEQKKAAIALYGELCKKFKLTPSTSTIRPHCWFTASGSYLGDYNKSKSAKSCPGTNFMGYGNTKTGFAKFITDVKNYIDSSSVFKQYIVRTTATSLNARKGPGTSYEIETKLPKGTAVTIVGQSGDWLKTKAGYWIHKDYVEFVKFV